jgi:outer membrane protein OmpA-like peptidoglycan-associated protein
MRARLAWSAILAGVALLPSRSAHAQAEEPGFGGMALDQLEPPPAGDPFFGVPSPFIGGHVVPRAAVIFDHSQDPLVLTSDSGATGAIVGSQTFLHIDASLALWDRLLVSALLPIAVAQSGDSPMVKGTASESPSSAAIGDLRLGLRVRLLGADDDPFQIGVGAYFHFPTGGSGSYAGEGAVRDTPHLLLGGRIAPIVWSASAGMVIRGSENPSTFTYSAGVALELLDGRLQVGPEFFGSTQLQDGSIQVTEKAAIDQDMGTNAELLLGGRVRLFGGLVLGAAAGPGLTSAVGTPAFRAVGSVGWAPAPEAAEKAPSDTDADGILDVEDACPHAFGVKSPGTKRHGCPVTDDDEDGVADPDDACPDIAGEASADPKKNGCEPPPPDKDGDGVADAGDACPGEKGEPSADPKASGCPGGKPVVAVVADGDGDGVPDAGDACPKEKGAASADAAASGCPKLVRVRDTEIAILAPVEFAPSKGLTVVLAPASDAVLGEVRDALAAHPEIVKLEVQAHTDIAGAAKLNELITEARAKAVLAWLVEHGVPAEKLVAKGYGSAKPIADNKTAAGRLQNKRMQFVVLEKKSP